MSMNLVGDAATRRIFETRPFPFSEVVIEIAHAFAVANRHLVTLYRACVITSTAFVSQGLLTVGISPFHCAELAFSSSLPSFTEHPFGKVRGPWSVRRCESHATTPLLVTFTTDSWVAPLTHSNVRGTPCAHQDF